MAKTKPVASQEMTESNKPAESVRGHFKSGRVWKNPKKRFSSIKKTRGLKIANALEKQMKRREELDRVKTISNSRRMDRQQLTEEKKQRRRDHIERKNKNQLKSEMVQNISAVKLKRMKKKQIRSLAKRDTTQVVK